MMTDYVFEYTITIPGKKTIKAKSLKEAVERFHTLNTPYDLDIEAIDGDRWGLWSRNVYEPLFTEDALDPNYPLTEKKWRKEIKKNQKRADRQKEELRKEREETLRRHTA